MLKFIYSSTQATVRYLHYMGFVLSRNEQSSKLSFPLPPSPPRMCCKFYKEVSRNYHSFLFYMVISGTYLTAAIPVYFKMLRVQHKYAVYGELKNALKSRI